MRDCTVCEFPFSRYGFECNSQYYDEPSNQKKDETPPFPFTGSGHHSVDLLVGKCQSCVYSVCRILESRDQRLLQCQLLIDRTCHMLKQTPL